MERRLAAILAADVVGYSRLMGQDEAGTVTALKSARTEVIEPLIARHQGRVVKLMGDGMLVEFSSVVSAVSCGVEIQNAMRERAANEIIFRIGIHLGDVIVDGDDIYGDGVNVATRIESIADPGGIAVSRSVRNHVGNRLDVEFVDRGEQNLKNIEKPTRVYSVLTGSAETDDVPAAMMNEKRPSIAVLPFSNMSGDPEQEYFSDGITEDIITDLSKVSGLYVAARNSAFIYKGKAANVQQVGRDLKVRYLVEGSVRKAGARVRVTGQLIDAATGGHIWGERYDRELTDIFAIQDQITHAIVAQLKVNLLPQERQSIERAPTESVEAYTYYLRGRELLYRGSTSAYKAAREMFTKAVELDPSYARAYAGIADCDTFLYLRMSEDISPRDIIAMSEKALALDGSLPEAHASRGSALMAVKRYDEAAAEFEKAIALNPDCFEAHFFYARSCVFQGKIEEAIGHFERAAEVKPDDYQCVCLLVQFYKSHRREAEMKAAAQKGVKLAAQQLIAHPDDARAAELGAQAAFELGDRDRALEWTSRALAIQPDNPPTQYNAACNYAQMGEFDRAFALLERGLLKAGPEWARWIEHDPSLDPLRTDPRYAALREKSRGTERS